MALTGVDESSSRVRLRHLDPQVADSEPTPEVEVQEGRSASRDLGEAILPSSGHTVAHEDFKHALDTLHIWGSEKKVAFALQ